MLDLLNQFLIDNATHELKGTITRAVTSLESLGVDDLDPSFEQMIILDDDVDTGDTVQNIVRLLRDVQQSTLLQHEISLSPEATMDDVSMILSGLITIQWYEDVETILRITSIDQNPAEIFAELMSLVSHKNADEILAFVEEVGQSLITRLSELTGTTSSEMVSDEERIERAHHVHLINRFCTYTQSNNYKIVELLAGGTSVGYPYLAYAETVGRAFEGILPEQIAKEMIAMALASSDGVKNPRLVIKPNLERYIASLNVITKVDIEITRLLTGFIYE